MDKGKTYSIEYSFFKREWKPSGRVGRKIYVIPSSLSFVKKEETDIKDLQDLRRFLSIEIEEKFGDALWDVRLEEGKYCLTIFRKFLPPEDFYALDAEVFALARLSKVLKEKDCFVLDLGKAKTTLVEIRDGELISYRVVLKGGDFIEDFVSSKLGITKEEARDIKFKEGVANPQVRTAFEKILQSLNKNLKEEKVLLSGGLSKLKGIESYIGKPLKNPYVDPELNSAFGASLKYIYRDCSPDFRRDELSSKEIKWIAAVAGFSFVLFLLSNVAIHLLEKRIVKSIREIEKREFKKVFPELPPIAVRDQVKSIVEKKQFPLTEKFLMLAPYLEEGIKIYKIHYEKNILRIEGEAKSKENLSALEIKKLKKLKEGGYEFEIEVK